VLEGLDRLAPDLVVFGGDVAAGGLPRETVERLRSVDRALFVQGNCDRELVDGIRGPLTGWAAEQLDDSDRRFLASFEPSVVVDEVLYCHATPYSDEPFVTVLTPDHLAAEIIGEVEQPVVVIGHTHSQFDRRLGAVRLVNAGSVGMPSEERPGAYWLLVEDGEPTMRRTDYNLQAAAGRVRAGGWPDAEQWIRDNLLTVPSVREHAELLESNR
jgi:predicted phosphodiesterase